MCHFVTLKHPGQLLRQLKLSSTVGQPLTTPSCDNRPMMNSQPPLGADERLALVHPWTCENPAKVGPKKRPRQQEAYQTEACIVVKTTGDDLVEKAVPIRYPITLQHALRVKSAEHWIEHGQPDEALRELEKLPRKAWKHPWATRVRVAAVDALRELNGQAHTE